MSYTGFFLEFFYGNQKNKREKKNIHMNHFSETTEQSL